MMGSTHALSGLLVGTITAPIAPVHGTIERICWVAAWGGFALLPDADTRTSRAARLWGPPTRLAGHLIGRAAGGHRARTHDLIIAPTAFGAGAALCLLHPYATLALLAVTIGLALVALDPILPGKQDHPLTNAATSWGTAYALTQNHPTLWWLPIAAAGGVIIHILGDWPTTAGIPIPLQRTATFGPALFATGSRTETLIRATMWVALAATTGRIATA